jgi:hypothetical protein
MNKSEGRIEFLNTTFIFNNAVYTTPTTEATANESQEEAMFSPSI